MKIIDRTILKIARLYGLVDVNEGLAQITDVSQVEYESFVEFRFTVHRESYVGLYGSDIDEELISTVFVKLLSQLIPLRNPLDKSVAITPFLGKSVVLYQKIRTNERLDIYLTKNINRQNSRSYWRQLIKSGAVTVNGRVATSQSQLVSPTDDIAIEYPTLAQEAEELPILFQNDNVLVVNKPTGILTHSKGGITTEPTVASVLKHLTSFKANNDRPGIVHRLDRDTSGLLIVARNEQTASFLQKQFSNRSVKKIYYAVVEGIPKHQEAIIDLPIGRNPAKPSTFKVSVNGKEARTAYKVVASNTHQSLIQLNPSTGRTHQLRVHLAYINTPIVGDRVYGTPGERLMLHAHQLSITIQPGLNRDFVAPLPKAFTDGFPDIKIDSL